MKQQVMMYVLVLALIPSVNRVADAQTKESSTKHKLERAMKLYSSAKFDAAIEILSELAKDNSLEKKDRIDVLFGLGRAHIAKGQKDKALWAMSKLLDEEPPMIEPDPDTECPPLMKIYYQARKAKAGTDSVRTDPGIQTIAVLDFMNRSIDDKAKFDPMEKGFSELIINSLSGATNLKVIERERIQWILDEIGLENDPSKFDQTSAVRVGKQLGVHTVLLGSFIKLRGEMKLLARLVKVETSEILATEDIKGDVDDVFELADKLSEKVAKTINVKLAQMPTGSMAKSTTENLDAMLSYSAGLDFLEKGNYIEAYRRFEEALKYDPNYEKARQKQESIRPLIG
jgi:TolB-like protein